MSKAGYFIFALAVLIGISEFAHAKDDHKNDRKLADVYTCHRSNPYSKQTVVTFDVDSHDYFQEEINKHPGRNDIDRYCTPQYADISDEEANCTTASVYDCGYRQGFGLIKDPNGEGHYIPDPDRRNTGLYDGKIIITRFNLAQDRQHPIEKTLIERDTTAAVPSDDNSIPTHALHLRGEIAGLKDRCRLAGYCEDKPAEKQPPLDNTISDNNTPRGRLTPVSMTMLSFPPISDECRAAANFVREHGGNLENVDLSTKPKCGLAKACVAQLFTGTCSCDSLNQCITSYKAYCGDGRHPCSGSLVNTLNLQVADAQIVAPKADAVAKAIDQLEAAVESSATDQTKKVKAWNDFSSCLFYRAQFLFPSYGQTSPPPHSPANFTKTQLSDGGCKPRQASDISVNNLRKLLYSLGRKQMPNDDQQLSGDQWDKNFLTISNGDLNDGQISRMLGTSSAEIVAAYRNFHKTAHELVAVSTSLKGAIKSIPAPNRNSDPIMDVKNVILNGDDSYSCLKTSTLFKVGPQDGALYNSHIASDYSLAKNLKAYITTLTNMGKCEQPSTNQPNLKGKPTPRVQ